MIVYKKLQKLGSSKGIIINKYERDILNIKDVVKITIEKNRLVIEKTNNKEKNNFYEKRKRKNE